MFDPRRLQVLVELDARGSVAAVADALSFSASAVSQQLAQLEREVGTPLTEKAGRRLVLTEAGRRFAEHGARLKGVLEEILADVETSNEHLSATIRLASIESALWHVVPRALAALGGVHPGIRVDCHEIDPQFSISGVFSGIFDLAVVDAYESPFIPTEKGLQLLKVANDPIFIALPSQHALATRPGTLQLSDLAEEVWVSPDSTSTLTQYQIRTSIEIGRFVPNIRHRTNNFGVAQKLVAAGQAVAMIPRLACESAPNIVLRRVEDIELSRDLFLVTRESSNPRPALSALSKAILSSEREVSQEASRLV